MTLPIQDDDAKIMEASKAKLMIENAKLLAELEGTRVIEANSLQM